MAATNSGSTLIARPRQFFIGGEWCAPSSDEVINVITPSTEELFVQVAKAQAADIERAVSAARTAFDRGPWPRLTHAERAAYLQEIAKGWAARSGDLATIWTSEMGILKSMADLHARFIPGTYKSYASLAETFPFEERHKPRAGGKVGLLVREPVGVVAAIIAWNGPAPMIAQKVAPALLAGCTVILKPAPEAPGAAYLFAEICEAAGLPAGVVNVVTADRDVSELLVRHPGVDKVTFTGSSAAGKRIAAICGERIARCTLELGGKSPAIVLDDYDIGTVAQMLSGTIRLMTGQICSMLTRVVVSRRRQDELLEAMKATVSSIKVGDPFAAGTEMGPVAMSRQRDRVEGYISKGVAEGARIVTGGGRPASLDRGFFVEPTVFGNVDNRMTIAREEIFGPVISVIPADDEAHAIAIANDSAYGLNATVFTNDAERAYRVARQLQSGTVGHNAFRIDYSIAFGGFKQSGIGREGSTEGLLPFLETKTVILEGNPAHIHD
jgi:acyl-CoA reductase-like NAD-dependent aldehyde dehydrogenase